ncbi:hypothetical protein CAEBREN_20676 [Caenorhabditis brenneri]|uniref:Uncharacterized protein n=1 Tax=Caenorhabditis brenneri TaxID=135651 RepID=G0N344_CAEBE|nr:hypothetical protein CAEBREN_20676 [Caenorhabditis brenneri]
MFHVQMEIHSFNSDLDIKKSCGGAGPMVAEPSSNGERKLIDRALEERRKGFKRSCTAYFLMRPISTSVPLHLSELTGPLRTGLVRLIRFCTIRPVLV